MRYRPGSARDQSRAALVARASDDYRLTMSLQENETQVRAWPNYTRQRERSLTATTKPASNNLCDHAWRWILPWSIDNYPGLRRGILEVLGNAWTWSAVRHWRSARRRMPVLAAQRFRDYIAGRCEQGMALVTELDKYIAEFERKPAGWQVVKDRDGDGSTRDGRNRVGKRKVKPHTQP